MNKEWLTRYYRSLGWIEPLITAFLERVERSNEEQERKKSVGSNEIK